MVSFGVRPHNAESSTDQALPYRYESTPAPSFGLQAAFLSIWYFLKSQRIPAVLPLLLSPPRRFTSKICMVEYFLRSEVCFSLLIHLSSFRSAPLDGTQHVPMVIQSVFLRLKSTSCTTNGDAIWMPLQLSERTVITSTSHAFTFLPDRSQRRRVK